MSQFSLTYYLTQCNLERFVDNHFGEQDVEAALQRLGRLSQDEARMTALEILKVVHGLLRNLNIVMDGEKRRSACPTPCVDNPFL